MEFNPGDSIMYWRPGTDVESGSWHGPGKIIMVEPPNTIWVSHMTRLFRFAPEHARHVSSRELGTSTEPQDDPSSIRTGVFQYHDSSTQLSGPAQPVSLGTGIPDEILPDTPTSNPGPDGAEAPPQSGDSVQPNAEPNSGPPSLPPEAAEPMPDPADAPIPESDTEDPMLTSQHQDLDFWEIRGSQLIRHHQRPRLKLFVPSDCGNIPIPVQQLGVDRVTQGTERTGSSFDICDQWHQSMKAHQVRSEIWTGRTVFTIINHSQIPTEDVYTSQM